MAGTVADNCVRPSDIATEYLPIVSAFVRCRLPALGRVLSSATLAATNQGNMLIFCREKLVRYGDLPFKNCVKLSVYYGYNKHSCQCYAVASSADNVVALVILETLQVARVWLGVSLAEVRDANLTGNPQVILHFNGGTEPVIVTCESDWHSQAENTVLSKPSAASLALVGALESRLHATYENLLFVERETSVRNSIYKYHLDTLERRVNNRLAFLGKPSYLTRLSGFEAPSVSLQNENANPVLITYGEVWKSVIDSHWIVGTSITNNYDESLTNVHCVLVVDEGALRYQTHYYPFKSLATLDQTLCGHFDGTLVAGESVTFVVTSLPDPVSPTELTGNLLLIFDRRECGRAQLVLGKVSLCWRELWSQLDHITTGCESIFRSSVALWSLLSFHLNCTVMTKFGPAIGVCYEILAKELQLDQVVPRTLLAGKNNAGRLLLLFMEPTDPHRIDIVVRCTSVRSAILLRHQLAVALPDGASLSSADPSRVAGHDPKASHESLTRRLWSAISLLNDPAVKMGNATVDDIQVVDSTIQGSSPLDVIRQRFRSEQLKFGENRPRGQRVVPMSLYRQWQSQD